MIEVGLMWVRTNGQRTIEEEVTTAARRHVERFGTWPNVCYASPGLLGAGVERVTVQVDEQEVQVYPDTRLAPGHLWLGVEPCQS